MPELPEVETTRLGISPHILGREILALIVREGRLRWPVPPGLDRELPGRTVLAVERRAKYLLIRTESGTLLLHLGMSGSLRILPRDTPPLGHDHIDLVFGDRLLRLRDPRRFGCLLWTRGPAERHRLLRDLGPEPLGPDFDGGWLRRQGERRRTAVKNLLMDGKVVAGVGNIYANEALFRAGIHPLRSSNRISRSRYQSLAEETKQVLRTAIARGGTTLRDFQREDGRPGYFTPELLVYGRAGEPCPRCAQPLRRLPIGQRSSYYCSRCQR